MASALRGRLEGLRRVRPIGRVTGLGHGALRLSGLGGAVRLGDRIEVMPAGARAVECEVIGVGAEVLARPGAGVEALRLGDRARAMGPPLISPHAGWLGRIIDPDGRPLDGRPLPAGGRPRPLDAAPPPAAARRRLGPRMATGLAAFDALLPLARGQRIGLFAGSGVGKSSLLADLARGAAADVVVVALVGERGRELRAFVEDALGPEGLARAVLVVATSDRPASLRRRCAPAAMAVAEHFRDMGRHVLYLCDSVTRFAEAHREIALAAGEPASLRGHPPSMPAAIAGLAERAGPGAEGAGDITAVFSVLVAGSDMEEPVADTLRGVLDGHVVLSRAIAERGRFPAIDLPASVSRSLPGAASERELPLIARARRLLGAHARSEMMIRAGLHTPGADPELDEAVRLWPALDAFLGHRTDGVEGAFAALAAALEGDAPGRDGADALSRGGGREGDGARRAGVASRSSLERIPGRGTSGCVEGLRGGAHLPGATVQARSPRRRRCPKT